MTAFEVQADADAPQVSRVGAGRYSEAAIPGHVCHRSSAGNLYSAGRRARGRGRFGTHSSGVQPGPQHSLP
jgi:hypothetical protein